MRTSDGGETGSRFAPGVSGRERWGVVAVTGAMIATVVVGAALGSGSPGARVEPALSAEGPHLVSESNVSVLPAGNSTPAASASEAMLLASTTGLPVEDISQRSATTQTIAQPDGDWVRREWLAPMWVEVPDDEGGLSTWLPVDLSLEASADGRLRPKAFDGDISFADGTDDDGPLASWRIPDSDVVLELESPVADIAAPVVEGARARYLDVFPGVDLVLDVTNHGFEQYFVVASRDVLDGARASLQLRFDVVGGSTVVDDEGLAITAANGTVVARLPQAFAWDAVNDAYRTSPVLAPWRVGVDESLSNVPLPDEVPLAVDAVPTVTGFTVGVPVDPTWASAATTVFPIVLDPAVYSANATLDTTLTSGASANTARYDLTEMLLGKDPTYSNISRPMLAVSTTTMKTLDVTAASLYLWNYWSATCTQYGWYVYRSAVPTTSTTWNNQPSVTAGPNLSTATWGHDSGSNPLCARAWVSIDITNFALAWKTESANTQGLMLTAADENNASAWKRFYSLDNASSMKPYVTFTYNRKPNTPTGLVYAPATSTTRAKLSATVTDPDGGNVRAAFTIERRPIGSTGSWETTIDKSEGSQVTSGAVSSREFDLIAGFEYRFTAYGYDTRLFSDAATAPVTGTVTSTSPFVDVPATNDGAVNSYSASRPRAPRAVPGFTAMKGGRDA